MDSGILSVQAQPTLVTSLLFQTELPQSSVAVALPNTNNTMDEAAEFDRLGSNSLHEN